MVKLLVVSVAKTVAPVVISAVLRAVMQNCEVLTDKMVAISCAPARHA